MYARIWLLSVYIECWVNVSMVVWEITCLSRYLCKLLCVTIYNICISLFEINGNFNVNVFKLCYSSRHGDLIRLSCCYTQWVRELIWSSTNWMASGRSCIQLSVTSPGIRLISLIDGTVTAINNNPSIVGLKWAFVTLFEMIVPMLNDNPSEVDLKHTNSVHRLIILLFKQFFYQRGMFIKYKKKIQTKKTRKNTQTVIQTNNNTQTNTNSYMCIHL